MSDEPTHFNPDSLLKEATKLLLTAQTSHGGMVVPGVQRETLAKHFRVMGEIAARVVSNQS